MGEGIKTEGAKNDVSRMPDEIQKLLLESIDKNALPYIAKEPLPQDMNIISGKRMSDALGGDLINFVIACIVFFVVGYLVSNFMIKKFHYATPGRLGNYSTDDDDDNSSSNSAKGDGTSQPERIIVLLGGDRKSVV